VLFVFCPVFGIRFIRAPLLIKNTRHACRWLITEQVITVQIRIDKSVQTLPHPHVLLPKIQALREALQRAQVCKKVRTPPMQHFNTKRYLLHSCPYTTCCLIHAQTAQSRDLVYYKLVEWMQAIKCTRTNVFVIASDCVQALSILHSRSRQVDIVKLFAASLDTSPW
jgi:hypothetical protein